MRVDGPGFVVVAVAVAVAKDRECVGVGWRKHRERREPSREDQECEDREEGRAPVWCPGTETH